MNQVATDEGKNLRRYQRVWVKSYIEARLEFESKQGLLKRIISLGHTSETISCQIKDISKKGVGIIVNSETPINSSCSIYSKISGVDFRIAGTIRNCYPLKELTYEIKVNCALNPEEMDGLFFCGIEVNADVDDLMAIMTGLRIVDISNS